VLWQLVSKLIVGDVGPAALCLCHIAKGEKEGLSRGKSEVVARKLSEEDH
jgi:hypothetical protein